MALINTSGETRLRRYDPRGLEHDQLLVGGEWRKPHSSSLIQVFSANTEQLIGSVPDADPVDVDSAVQAARTAFDDPAGWSHWEPTARAVRRLPGGQVGKIVQYLSRHVRFGSLDRSPPHCSRTTDRPASSRVAFLPRTVATTRSSTSSPFLAVCPRGQHRRHRVVRPCRRRQHQLRRQRPVPFHSGHPHDPRYRRNVVGCPGPACPALHRRARDRLQRAIALTTTGRQSRSTLLCAHGRRRYRPVRTGRVASLTNARRAEAAPHV